MCGPIRLSRRASSEAQMLTNIQRVQRRQNLAVSQSLIDFTVAAI
jgi:hypothetical protein